VHVLRTLAEASTLRRQFRSNARLVVVGGGFVGSEVASTALSLGLDVTMLELDSAPLVNILGQEIGGILVTRYRAHGAEVRCGTRAVAFKAGTSGRVNRVVLAEGDDAPCDVALVAVGVEPARELISPTQTQSIVVCGDAAGGPGHWTSAAQSGVNAARRLLGIEPLPSQPSFFWSDQFGLRIQLVGDPRRAVNVHIDGDEESFVARYLTRAGALAAALAANRPTAVAELRRELAFAA
jgi:NADPH-dependent 2,4-dienoyl-CoA reductase/sulfur reductase-like enzyme